MQPNIFSRVRQLGQFVDAFCYNLLRDHEALKSFTDNLIGSIQIIHCAGQQLQGDKQPLYRQALFACDLCKLIAVFYPLRPVPEPVSTGRAIQRQNVRFIRRKGQQRLFTGERQHAAVFLICGQDICDLFHNQAPGVERFTAAIGDGGRRPVHQFVSALNIIQENFRRRRSQRRVKFGHVFCSKKRLRANEGLSEKS
ncbi:hypothetical protein CI740_17585 [Klebsiella pneumoniae subsp. pneumoniae]|nr:hypothetical protein CI740_17585 [Klebsiella pneumoniae subsp. pneumoniae]